MKSPTELHYSGITPGQNHPVIRSREKGHAQEADIGLTVNAVANKKMSKMNSISIQASAESG